MQWYAMIHPNLIHLNTIHDNTWWYAMIRDAMIRHDAP
jgi:hypothetical protein